jgi:tetratricopeptide (TPR) repeat protein
MMLRDEITEPIRPIPQRRVIEKMNEYMSRRDYAGADRHLHYWLAEAQLGRDRDGQLMLRNEMVGHYRKTGQKDKAMESAREALALLAEMGLEDAVIAGTTYVNIATACNAFGDFERSRELFEKARAVYEGSEHVEPQLLGGLYNNMALTYAALGRYEEALALYEKAVRVMTDVPDGELEQAITFLNMANAVEAQLGMEEGESRIYELVDRAEELLERKGREMLGADGAGGRGPQPNGSAAKEAALALRERSREERARVGYYAFVCEKCAPTFEYYGYFLTAEALKETAEKIYREE